MSRVWWEGGTPPRDSGSWGCFLAGARPLSGAMETAFFYACSSSFSFSVRRGPRQARVAVGSSRGSSSSPGGGTDLECPGAPRHPRARCGGRTRVAARALGSAPRLRDPDSRLSQRVPRRRPGGSGCGQPGQGAATAGAGHPLGPRRALRHRAVPAPAGLPEPSPSPGPKGRGLRRASRGGGSRPCPHPLRSPEPLHAGPGGAA